MLMPKLLTGNNNIKLNVDPNDPAPFPPYLPLETFDDDEFDCRTAADWLVMGMEDNVRKPVPGRALLPTDDKKRNCKDCRVAFFKLSQLSIDWC
jgi:dynein heavy chain